MLSYHFFVMGSTEHLIDEILVALVQRHGLTGPQLVVLRELKRSGQIPVGQLAENVSLSHATVTGILERLEKQGLVEKKPDVVDRRRVLAHITRGGEGRVEEAPPILQERFAAELRKLQDWERTLILSSLQRIGTMMEARDAEAAPVLVTGPVAVTKEASEEFLKDLETKESVNEEES
jgi:DNA-binding MarR family transcriptional regulator